MKRQAEFFRLPFQNADEPHIYKNSFRTENTEGIFFLLRQLCWQFFSVRQNFDLANAFQNQGISSRARYMVSSWASLLTSRSLGA